VAVTEEDQRARADRLNVTIVARVNLATGGGLPLLVRRLRAALNAQAVGTHEASAYSSSNTVTGDDGGGPAGISPYGWMRELGRLVLSSSCIGECGALHDATEGGAGGFADGEDDEEERELLSARDAGAWGADRGGKFGAEAGWRGGGSFAFSERKGEDEEGGEWEEGMMTTMESCDDDDDDEVPLDGADATPRSSHSREMQRGRSRGTGRDGERSSFLSTTAKALLPAHTPTLTHTHLDRDNRAVGVSTAYSDRDRQRRNALALDAANYYSMVDNDVFSPYFNT
jgi:hypothetical protein